MTLAYVAAITVTALAVAPSGAAASPEPQMTANTAATRAAGLIQITAQAPGT
jgi:hypothetical protein